MSLFISTGFGEIRATLLNKALEVKWLFPDSGMHVRCCISIHTNVQYVHILWHSTRPLAQQSMQIRFHSCLASTLSAEPKLQINQSSL